jgi:hypothetical protein
VLLAQSKRHRRNGVCRPIPSRSRVGEKLDSTAISRGQGAGQHGRNHSGSFLTRQIECTTSYHPNCQRSTNNLCLVDNSRLIGPENPGTKRSKSNVPFKSVCFVPIVADHFHQVTDVNVGVLDRSHLKLQAGVWRLRGFEAMPVLPHAYEMLLGIGTLIVSVSLFRSRTQFSLSRTAEFSGPSSSIHRSLA